MNVLTLSHTKIHEGCLILVNRDFPFHTSALNRLVSVSTQPSILLQEEAAIQLENLMNTLCGWDEIVSVSGWRSYEEQQKIWDETLVKSGLAFTQKYVAVPGHSEHQTGLAVDLGIKKEPIDFICPEFPYTGISQRFRQLAPEYGFIERYPASKESITGIGHEPWHFRYVGVPHAKIMSARQMVLEEYIAFVKQFVYRKNPYITQIGTSIVSISFLPFSDNRDFMLEINPQHSYNVSGNNYDGFIITEWR